MTFKELFPINDKVMHYFYNTNDLVILSACEEVVLLRREIRDEFYKRKSKKQSIQKLITNNPDIENEWLQYKLLYYRSRLGYALSLIQKHENKISVKIINFIKNLFRGKDGNKT